MARAGEAIARRALARAPPARNNVVFAGPGNNGGDGIEAATRLHGWGKQVAVVRVGDASRPPADAARALARAQAAGVRIDTFEAGRPADADAPELVVDALLGIGASREPEGAVAAAIARIGELSAGGARVLSVDVPSGLDVERGRPLGAACVVADDTLTLIAPKPGLFTGDGRDHAGRIWCARIGVETRHDDADAWLVGVGDPVFAPSPRLHRSHKGSFGDVAIVGGAPGMAGAAWLAARAAHAAGAGRVFVDLLPDPAGAPARDTLDPLRPELMCRPGWAGSGAAAVALATVVCGCGGGDAVRAVLPRLLSAATRLVLDADALNAIAADPSLLALVAARDRRGHSTILTPHPLEAARLLATDVATVQGDRVTAGRELAAKHRAVVVLKGSGTVIASVDGSVRIAATGNPSLASAGTGDVLAGWIGGRWAALGGHADEVALRGVVEHGAAAEPERPGAFRAADLVEALHARTRGG
jgi:hydroxyethylthiazole kinase-like uncharacterized protein yjeF